MKKNWKWLLGLCLIIFIIYASIGPIMSKVEQPKYQVLSSDKNIEIRAYQPMITAHVQVAGNRKDALSKGFKLLADYIFGNNQLNTNIAITAPVKQQASGDAWTINFVMPSKYTLKTLPKPVDKKIKIQVVPSKTYAAIKFSGMNTSKNFLQHEKILIAYFKKNELKPKGSPIYAFYNPPWTLPILRRNEVLIELDN